MRFYLVALLLALPIAFGATAYLSLPAVTEDGRASLVNISVESRPGAGDVYVSITPFAGEQFQQSLQSSVAYVKSKHQLGGNDFLVKSDAGEVALSLDGPSAGAALSILMRSLIENKPLRHDMTITGGIDGKGNIIQVGSLIEKAGAAHSGGKKIIFVPLSGADDSAMLDRLMAEEDIHIVYYTNIEEVYAAFTSDEPTPTQQFGITYPLSNYSFSSQTLPPTDPNSAFSPSVSSMVGELSSTLGLIKDKYPEAHRYLSAKAALAKSLEDNGYTYSAGNEAFLALNRLRTLTGDLSDGNLAVEKANVEDCLSRTSKNLDSYNGALENYLNAELRYFWAKREMENLGRTDTVAMRIRYKNSLSRAQLWCNIANDLSSSSALGTHLNKTSLKELDESLFRTYFGSKGDHLLSAAEAYDAGYYGAAMVELSMHESEVNNSYDAYLGNYTAEREWTKMMLAHSRYLASNSDYGNGSSISIARFALFMDMHLDALESRNVTMLPSNTTQIIIIGDESNNSSSPSGFILLILACILVVAVQIFLSLRGRKKRGFATWKTKTR